MGGSPQQLLEKARRCRELADTAMTEEGKAILQEMARNYELEAAEPTLPRRTPGPVDAALA